jgi:hypothetical protein
MAFNRLPIKRRPIKNFKEWLAVSLFRLGWKVLVGKPKWEYKSSYCTIEKDGIEFVMRRAK